MEHQVNKDGLLHGGKRYNRGDSFKYDESNQEHQNMLRSGKIVTMSDKIGVVVTGDDKGNVKGISPAADSQNPEAEANAFADDSGNAEQQNQSNEDKKAVSAKAAKKNK